MFFKKIMKMIKSNIFLLFIIFVLFSTLYFSNNEYVRCSSIGHKLFDDILGLDIGYPRCVAYNHNKINLQNNLDKYHEENRYSKLELKKEVVCPSNSDVIVLLGQSNATNALEYEGFKKNKHLNYFNGKCYSLTDQVLGTTGELQSLVPSLSSKIISNKPIIFLTNGWGGTSILDWSHDESVLSKYANENILELAKNNNLKYIIWIQGEADNNTNIDYEYHFLKFKKILLQNLTKNQKENIKFIITQTSICRNERDLVLNQHQKNLGKMKYIFTTEVTDNLDNSYRFDKCHFNKYGIEAITEEISKIING